MGIEPTRDFVEPHTGFEDQGHHQDADHLHDLHPLSTRREKGQAMFHATPRAIVSQTETATDEYPTEQQGMSNFQVNGDGNGDGNGERRKKHRRSASLFNIMKGCLQ
jgi:hypothetical protein